MFCSACPVVAFDAGECDRTARLGLPDPREYGLLGFIDWDEVPEDKKDVEVGSEDNPIPLAEFASAEWLDGSATFVGSVPARPAPEPGRGLAPRKGPSWNAPCPCGSGAKYKKCCGRTGHDEWSGKTG